MKPEYTHDKEQVDTYTSLDGFIDNLTERRTVLTANGWINLGMEIQSYGYDYDPTDYHGLFITGARPLTDEEIQVRNAEYERRRKLQMEAELEQLAMLKKKYDK